MGLVEGRLNENKERLAAGDGDATGVDDAAGDAAVAAVAASFFFERFCLAGLAEAAAVGDSAVAGAEAEADGAGEGDASLSFFFECLVLAGLAEASAAGDSEAAVVAAGDASLSFFLECFALAGLGDTSAVAVGDGLWEWEVTTENAARATAMVRPMSLFITHASEGWGVRATLKWRNGAGLSASDPLHYRRNPIRITFWPLVGSDHFDRLRRPFQHRTRLSVFTGAPRPAETSAHHAPEEERPIRSGGSNGAADRARGKKCCTRVVRGKENSEVAEILQASPETIRKHVEHIRRKYRSESRLSVISTYWQRQLDERDRLIKKLRRQKSSEG